MTALNSGQVLASIGSIFTATTTGTKVKQLVFHNTNTTAEILEVHIVPNSGGALGTPTNATKLLKKSLAQDETYTFPVSYPFNFAINDSVQAVTTTAGQVNFWVLGV